MATVCEAAAPEAKAVSETVVWCPWEQAQDKERIATVSEAVAEGLAAGSVAGPPRGKSGLEVLHSLIASKAGKTATVSGAVTPGTMTVSKSVMSGRPTVCRG